MKHVCLVYENNRDCLFAVYASEQVWLESLRQTKGSVKNIDEAKRTATMTDDSTFMWILAPLFEEAEALL